MTRLTLVTGAGGFIGGQLVRDLVANGVAVRAVDKSRLMIGTSAHLMRKTSSPICSSPKPAIWPARGSGTFIISPPIWAAWALLRATKPAACCRC